MKLARGILIDAKGNFLGAFQWDASRPRPNFNLPRRGKQHVRLEDRKTLLAENVAEEGMEFKRWDKKQKKWIEPDQKGWFVDTKGNARGSKRFFADQPPNVPVGWTFTLKTLLVERGKKAYFDLRADEWKFPVRQPDGTLSR